MQYNLPVNLNIFIGNLPLNLNRKQVRKYFQTKGDFERIQMPLDPKNHKNKGYLYLKCKEPETFIKFLNMEHSLNGVTLVLREYYELIDRQRMLDLQKPKTIIFLKNISPELTNGDLLHHFKNYGEVKAAFSFKGQKEDKRVFTGFVQFQNEVSVWSLPTKTISIKGNTVTWRRFVRRREPNAPNEKNLFKRTTSPLKEFYSWIKTNSEKVYFNHPDSNIHQFRDMNFRKKKSGVDLFGKFKWEKSY